MQPRPSRWACPPYDVRGAWRLAEELAVSPTVAAVLARRGLGDAGAARRFLAADERHDPLSLHGMAAARDLIGDHVRRGSPIAVHGDYDVDGVCATAIVIRALRALGAAPVWELPSRFGDGYGLSSAAVERLAARGVRLLVTVDCGITAVEQIAAARAAGMDVLVTDHHRPGERLPDCAVVHPALGGYPCPDLCAAGVALKLSEVLRGPEAAADDLDLAALATVADLVPLRGENRRIVREGLVALSRTRKPGLRALMEVAGLEPGEVSEHALGFRMGPRINAAGRMTRADAALELLMTDDGARAQEVARELDLLNKERQETELRIVIAAEEACEQQASRGALVVAGEGWHPGVVGIVASRLVERWRRPAVVIALDGANGRGSGRSIGAYDLHGGLAACADHLVGFGGHRMAAGLEIETANVERFRAAFARHAAGALTPADLIAVERVDAVVPGGALGLPLAEELERLRPFGQGNPQPTLLVPAARIESVAGMGEERKHARFTVVTGGSRSRGVAFGSAPGSLTATKGVPHDLALRLERNRWNGMVEPRVVLRACCPTSPGELHVLGEDEPFWTRLRAELERDPEAQPPGPDLGPAPHDRRGEGFAGVAGDLLTSGDSVLVAVADVPRRRAALESLVAGLAPQGLHVASWTAIAGEPALAASHDHLLALDPPPAGAADPLLRSGPAAHMAWGPAEVEFARAVARAEYELRPALVDAWRTLRALPPDAGPDHAERALRGAGRYPRGPECCGRIVRVLTELGLAEAAGSEPAPGAQPARVRILEAPARTDLERSAAFRAYRERGAAIERALAAEVRGPAAAPGAAAAGVV
ncbi:MAG TPA: single-stranded-DNA-specific exonuclease RecJ [Thermoleophilaceae bacterium]|jgi:single-stranded-DNA-specific exonuclease